MLKMLNKPQKKEMLKKPPEKLEKWLLDQLMFMEIEEDQLLITLEFLNKPKKEDHILMDTKEKISEMLTSLLIKLIMPKN